MKKCLLYILSIVAVFVFLCYLSFLIVVPDIVNSSVFQNKLAKFLLEKNGITLKLDNFRIKTTPLLKVKIISKLIELEDESKNKILSATNFNSEFGMAKKQICAENIYVNGDLLKKYTKDKKSNKKTTANFGNLPQICIAKAEYYSEEYSIKAADINIDKNTGTFVVELNSSKLSHKLILGKEGSLTFDGSKIIANNILVSLGNGKLYIDGVIKDGKKHDFTVEGNSFPIEDIEKGLLYYQKLHDPAKKFIENFYDFSGNLDVKLNFKENGIFGICSANNLSAKTVMFSIPIFFEKADFLFEGKSLISNAEGTLGKEHVNHILEIVNMGTSNKEVNGFVTADLSESFRYIPHLTILNTVQAKLNYNIKNRKIVNQYLVDIKENADLLYKDAFLGLRNKNRRLYAKTVKEGNSQTLEEYNYYTINDNKAERILVGKGLFVKENCKMEPKFITFKTNGFAPASVTGSFKKYITDGEFQGDMKYDFTSGKILGSFELVNAKFKNFYVDSAKVISDEKITNVTAVGTYFGEHFTAEINAINGFKENITIKSLDLFLNKFVVKKGTSSKKTSKLNISNKVKDTDVTIDNWTIRLNEIQKDRIVLNNIKLLGSLKNNIFNFSMPELKFAEGILKANGKYNFSNDSSDICFTASNINSGTIADLFFDLPDEVVGTADASLHLITTDKLNDIKASAKFSVKEGFLPKLGNMGFMVKNTKRINIADLVNVDLTRKDSLQSDIKGGVDFDNSLVKNINLTTQQKFLSTYINGNYNIHKQDADLNIYGKYNKEAPKGVKILFVPLNLLLKAVFRPESTMDYYKNCLEKVPSIEAAKNDEQYFRIKLNGNLRKEKLQVEIKSIK